MAFFSRLRTTSRKTTLFVVVLVAFVAVSAVVGLTGVGPGGSGPRVTQVPASIPAGGVQVGDVLLSRWTSTPAGAMSEAQALAAALHFANKHFPATALKADLTLPSNHAIDHVPVWLVTYTSPKPIDISQGSTPLYVTHRSVAVNAVTGKFVLAFFTP